MAGGQDINPVNTHPIKHAQRECWQRLKMRTALTGKGVKRKRGTVDKLTTVRGIVIPVEWDGEGNALAVAILSPDEQEYVIEQDKKGKELIGLIRQEVEVSGVVRKVIKGSKTITVKSYRLKTDGNW